MKSSSRMLLFVAVLGVGHGFGQSPQPEFTTTSALALSLSEPREALKSSSRLVLTLTVKNISSEVVHTSGCWLGGKYYHSYELDVRDGLGNPLPPKPSKETTAEGDFGSCRTYGLKPGKSFSFDIDVARDYALSKRGSYTIQVSIPGETERLVSEDGLTRAVRVSVGKGKSNKARAMVAQ